MSSVYILEIKSLSVVLLTNILSYKFVSLFTLQINHDNNKSQEDGKMDQDQGIMLCGI